MKKVSGSNGLITERRKIYNDLESLMKQIHFYFVSNPPPSVPSLWRARLVVSLDKGQGLDQQDWATFHLLIQHPLPIHQKLSLLHAPRICAANSNTGAGQVRAAMLQLARHAQVLLQPEEERPSDWKNVTAHPGQPWMPVKVSKKHDRTGYKIRY